jgi:hypothetical protein
MITIIKNRLLLLIGLLLTIGLVTSCDKNDDDDSGDVQLLSFGPTGAKHGDTLRFIGRNLNKVTEIVFTGTNASVAQKDFKEQTNELIRVVVPTTAEQGYVTLKTPNGDIVSKTRFNLNVLAMVASITPEARPGENITITGDYLNWVRQITFARDKVVTSFVSQTQKQIVVKVPDDAQTGPLVLAYAGTESGSFETDVALKVTLPVITGLAPNPVKHGTNLTITGTNLDLTSMVLFPGGDTVRTFASKTATQLVVSVPAKAQKGKITVVPASGVHSTFATDLTIIMPTITSFAPNPVDPGADLTIQGTNLDVVSSVKFQNAAAVTTFVSKTANQIVVKVPNGVLNGTVSLGIQNSTLSVISSAILEIAGNAPPPTIALPFYLDAVSSNWTGWLGGGWGGTRDMDNTAPVREGTKSIKINYTGGYGSPLQLGHNDNATGVSLAGKTSFKISVYGAPGSAGKRITIGFNKVNGKYNITVVEGKWTDYEIPISTLTSDTHLKEIWVQEYSGTGGFSVYVDAIGLN